MTSPEPLAPHLTPHVAQTQAPGENVVVATFYRFFPFADHAAQQKPLLDFMAQHAMRGSILLAPEGINATVSGPRESVDGLLARLRNIAGLEKLYVKESTAPAHPFGRAKVRLKKELIPMGRSASPAKRTGQHADAETWNRIIADPTTYILDARNDYEVQAGSFKGAVNPGTRHFSELPDFIEQHIDPAKHKRIATFCTGGIRCEKLTSWLMEKGFEEVWQLNGGILQYLEDMSEEQSLWEGECFVFDERVAVTHELEPSSTFTMNPINGHPVRVEEVREHTSEVKN